MLYKQVYSSPIGELSLVADEESLVGIWFLGQQHFEAGLVEKPVEKKTDLLARLVHSLESYFQTGQADFADLPLASRGTDFQRRVWSYLQDIPAGQTVTYGQIAQALGIRSAQAVGGAVGRNPWSILVPCHRVLGSQGQLTGYAGGLDKKIWLLQHEGISLDEKQISSYHRSSEKK